MLGSEFFKVFSIILIEKVQDDMVKNKTVINMVLLQKTNKMILDIGLVKVLSFEKKLFISFCFSQFYIYS